MTVNCKSPADVVKALKDDGVEFVDLRFTDPRGKWQHLAITAPHLSQDSFADGVMFDGSSIAGWKDISESDMALIPDPTTAVMDPFSAQDSLILICDVLEPSTGQRHGRRRHGVFRARGRVFRVRRRALRRLHEPGLL
jgi:glutamine synthetase